MEKASNCMTKPSNNWQPNGQVSQQLNHVNGEQLAKWITPD
jgi:hypothetical protein